MRKWLGRFLLLCAVLLVVGFALAARTLGRVFAPDTQGIEPSVFHEPSRAAEPAATWIPKDEMEKAPRPNIIVILADDLGHGDLSHPAIDVPHCDALAAEGVRCTSFYASAPVCTPSRASLLTGRYPLRTGVVTALPAAKDTMARKATRTLGIWMSQLGTVDMSGGDNPVMGLPECEITLAEALDVAGYESAAIGKWHLGDFTEMPEYHPFNHGFDHFVGFNMSNDDWPVAFWRGEEEEVEDIGLDQERYTRVFTEEAITFMEKEREGPFFLYLAHKDPHQPFFPSEDFKGISQAGPYGDAVEEFDWSVGQVWAAVERLGLSDNTLLVVTSDNGPWYEGSPGVLRGRKGQTYEGGFRVPFLAAWPGHIPAGSVCDLPAMQIDLFPTFLHLAGLGLPSDRIIDGADIMPMLTGGGLEPRPLYFFKQYDVEAVRHGPWKLIRANSHYTWPVPLDKQDNIAGQLSAGHHYSPEGSEESVPSLGAWPLLYHLGRDPGEAYNLAEREPERAGEMTAAMRQWRMAFLANPRGWRNNTDGDGKE